MKRSPLLPITFKDLVDSFEKKHRELSSTVDEMIALVCNTIIAEFTSKNGCTVCRGRGWVVIWDTFDSLSGCYARTGPCPNRNCTDESRRISGLHPLLTKYDTNMGVKDPVPNHALFHILVEPMIVKQTHIKWLLDRLTKLKKDIDSSSRILDIDVDVVVVKGRKVPIGTRGRAFWVGQSQYGLRVGLKNGDDTFWTAFNNVEFVVPEDMFNIIPTDLEDWDDELVQKLEKRVFKRRYR